MCCSASSATTGASKPFAAGRRSRSARLQASWLASESCACAWKKRCALLLGACARAAREAASAPLSVHRLTCACAQLRLRCAETKETDALRASLEAELAAVEEDVKRVEVELSAARSEVRCTFVGRVRRR